MNDNKAKEYTTQDYLFKKFREKLNIWLKAFGKTQQVVVHNGNNNGGVGSLLYEANNLIRKTCVSLSK